MNVGFYTFPIAADMLMQQKKHPKCSLSHSVAQHLHILLTTAFGEFAADESFGCCIWEYNFDNVTSAHKLKELIRQSLLTSIQQYEKRLSNVYIELVMRQEETKDNQTNHVVKKRIHITIKGLL